MNATPIILVGAARSGTKMVRDALARHQDVAKVPFDINYVWKYGNERIAHDLLEPEDLTPKIASFIQNYIRKRAGGSPFVIEKTVSNTIRIPYVYKIFPEAKFIYLVRDGRDVVESVFRQWGVPPNNSYLIEKIRTYPLRRAFSYGLKYASTFLQLKIFGESRGDYVWGVRYPGYKEDLQTMSTLEFCAKQWAYCVEKSGQSLGVIPPDNLYSLRYEDFVLQPSRYLVQIQEFLGLSEKIPDREIGSIGAENIGKGFSNLSVSDQRKVMDVIGPALAKLGYI